MRHGGRRARHAATRWVAWLAAWFATSSATLAAPLAAQDMGVPAALTQEVARVRALMEAGAGDEARLVIDSVVRAQPPASNALAEALWWRAAVAEQVSDAERDWKRVTMEAPLSIRTADALIRLADLERLRGHAVNARRYLERVQRDFPNTPQRVKATQWIARGTPETMR